MILDFAEFLYSIVSNLLFLRLSTGIKRQVKGARNEQVTQLSHTFITTLMKSFGDVIIRAIHSEKSFAINVQVGSRATDSVC